MAVLHFSKIKLICPYKIAELSRNFWASFGDIETPIVCNVYFGDPLPEKKTIKNMPITTTTLILGSYIVLFLLLFFILITKTFADGPANDLLEIIYSYYFIICYNNILCSRNQYDVMLCSGPKNIKNNNKIILCTCIWISIEKTSGSRSSSYYPAIIYSMYRYPPVFTFCRHNLIDNCFWHENSFNVGIQWTVLFTGVLFYCCFDCEKIETWTIWFLIYTYDVRCAMCDIRRCTMV